MGYYSAATLDTRVTPNLWRDGSGANNHVSISRGPGSVSVGTDTRGGKAFSYVKGTTADGVKFPQVFNTTNNYTLFHVTRCSPATCKCCSS